MNKYHYTYKLTEFETGLFYVGVRSCKCEPEEDTKYMGSMLHWKVDKSNLIKEIISVYDTREIANEAEIFMIRLQLKLNKNHLCMNVHIPNIGFCTAGKKMNDEFRRKVGDTSRGRIHSDETKHKISEAHKGKKLSNETKRKMSESKKGTAHSDQTKLKLREANIGKKISDETKRKISEASKKMSDETKRKISEAMKGNTIRRGTKLSDEHKRKIGEAQKIRLNKKNNKNE